MNDEDEYVMPTQEKLVVIHDQMPPRVGKGPLAPRTDGPPRFAPGFVAGPGLEKHVMFPTPDPRKYAVPPLLTAPAKPRVLCVPADEFSPFHGLLTDGPMSEVLDEVFLGGRLTWVDREAAESDPSFKQVIPYVVFLRGKEVFNYSRTKKGGEDRLHGFRSVGIGGHVEETDGEIGDAYNAGLLRELSEELFGEMPEGFVLPDPSGVVYDGDGSGGVGDVHLGVVYVVQLGRSPAPFKASDPAIANGQFNHPIDLRYLKSEFESWSRLVIEELL